MHSDHWVSFLLLFAFLRGTTKVSCVRIMYVYTYIIVYMYTRNEQHKLLKNSMHNYEPMSKLVQTHRQQNPFAEKCFGPSRAADLSRKLLWSYAHSQARLWGSSGGNKSTDPKWLRTQIRSSLGRRFHWVRMVKLRCNTIGVKLLNMLKTVWLVLNILNIEMKNTWLQAWEPLKVVWLCLIIII